MSRNEDGSEVTITVKVTGGDVLHKRGYPESKSLTGTIELKTKPMYADELKFGETLYFTVSTEKPQEQK